MSNLSTVVEAVSKQTNVNKKSVQEIAEAIFSNITSDLAKGEEVRISNFGTFKTSERAASTGRNPATGAEIQIAAKTVAKFSPAKALKDAVA